MNPKRLQAYINLIQQLLACPSGEEWILLRQHDALVTPEFVQVIEQVATQLRGQGNLKESKFLHNLAGQIHHFCTNQTVQPPEEDESSLPYLELIKALLDCPQGAEGKLLQANQALIGPGLVEMMKQVATQLTANGQHERANDLQNWAIELSRLWLQQHNFQPPLKPEPEPKHLDSLAPDAVTVPSPASGFQTTRPSPDEEEDVWAEPAQEPDQPSPDSLQTLNPIAPEPRLAALAPLPEGFPYSPLSPQLDVIAKALVKLSEAVIRPDPLPNNPLWYMDVLERAYAESWVLTSAEIQQLISVHPTCPKDSDSFRRGCWVFSKAGKVGTQTGWRVSKEQESTA